MLTLSNTISLLRAPFALLFLFQSTSIRVFAIIAAMISDCIDGYIARKFKHETFIGKVLDPVMDKFFVYFVLGVLFYQNKLTTFALLALLSRDISIIFYVITTLLIYRWKGLVFHPAIYSKITTALQFSTLLAIVIGYTPWTIIYHSFFLLSAFIFLEQMLKTIHQNKPTTSSNMQ